MATTIQCRRNQVLVRIVVKEECKGLVMPQSSPEGKEYIVESVGPDVKNLYVGDKVMIGGRTGEEWTTVPGHSDLVFNIDEHVPLVLHRANGETTTWGTNASTVGTVVDDIPIFDESQFPDADLSTKATERLAEAEKVMSQTEPEQDPRTLKFNVNGEPISVLIRPGMDEDLLFADITNLCQLKYGDGKLSHVGGDNYHWGRNVTFVR